MADDAQFLAESPNAGLQTIQDPDTRSLLQTLKREIARALNCHQVGRIVSFDADKQTATVQIMVQRAVYNQVQANNGALQFTPNVVDYPLLTDCPVFVHSGGGGRITLPVTAGDSCIVLFNDRDLDLWFETGAAAIPNSSRAHSFSDGMVLVGFRNLANRLTDYSATDIELRNLGGVIQVAAKLGISNASTSLLIALTDVMNTLTVAVAALTALNAKTGPSAATEIAAVATSITATQLVISSLLK